MAGTGRGSRAPNLLVSALGAWCIVAPQLLGGATDGTQLVVLVGNALLGLLGALWFSRRAPEGTTPLALLALAGGATWTTVQFVPLPCAWLRWLSPTRFEALDGLARVAPDAVGACMLSYAPGASLTAAALGWATLCLFATSVCAARAGGARTIALATGVSSVTMAGVGMAHVALDAQQVFGVYTPEYARPGLLLAPLLNGNHFAGLLALGFPVCGDRALRAKRMDARLLWGAACSLIIACGVLSLSRGGVAALALGGAGTLVLYVRRTGRASMGSALRWAAGVAVMVLAGALAGADLLARQFTEAGGPFDKVDFVVNVARHVAFSEPWFGVGRGAFADVSALALPMDLRIRYAESFPVQWVTEWGVPVTALVLAALVVSIWRLRLTHSASQTLALGLGALALQNLADFSLEMPGIAASAAIAAGPVFASETAHAAAARLPLVRAQRWLTGIAVGTALIGLPVLWEGRSSLAALLQQQLDRGSADIDDTLARAQRRFPLDPTFTLYAAARAVRADRAAAPSWLTLAMARAPGWPGPHLQAAFYFERMGRLDQAAVEHGVASSLDAGVSDGAMCEFLRRHPARRFAYAAAPFEEPRRRSALEAFARCLAMVAGSDAAQLYEELGDEYPSSIEVAERRARFRIARGDAEGALALARQALAGQRDGSPQALAMELEVMHAAGRGQDALQRFMSLGRSGATEAPAALRAAAAVASGLRDVAQLDALLHRLVAAVPKTPVARAEALSYSSLMRATAGDTVRAIADAQQAYTLARDPSLLEFAHRLADQAGLVQVESQLRMELCHQRYSDGRFCEPRPR